MKGIELPINILVMVAIAVIVLLGMVALYFVGSGQFGRSVSVQAAQNDACGVLVRSNCVTNTTRIQITNFDANMKDGITPGDESIFPTTCGAATKDNLAALCACYAGRYTETACKQLCGCQ